MLVIREAQLQVFSEALKETFRRRLARRLAETGFDGPINTFVVSTLQLALSHGIESEAGLEFFVLLVAGAGPEGLKAPSLGWFRDILADAEMTGNAKMTYAARLAEAPSFAGAFAGDEEPS
jgi:hypothetical protein